MKKLAICLMMLLPLTLGCAKKEKTAKKEKPLVPTPAEAEVMRVHDVDIETEEGQRKLRKLRERNEKLQAARERMESLIKEAEKRKAEKEAANQ